MAASVRIHRDPKTEKYIFEQGPIKFEISDNLDQTLGAGRFLGEGPLDKLTETQFKKLAEQNELPITPFFRDLLVKPLRRLLQREWYIVFEGQCPTTVLNNDPKRLEEFWAEFRVAAKTRTEATEKAARTAKANGRPAGFVAGPPKYYIPKQVQKDLKGQQALIAGWYAKHPEGGTSKQITEDLVAGGFTCNQDPERAIYYYLNEWKKKGWLEVADGPAEVKLSNDKDKKKGKKK